MNKEEAIKFLNDVSEAIYKQGTVSMTPEAHEQFKMAIEILSKDNPAPPKPKV